MWGCTGSSYFGYILGIECSKKKKGCFPGCLYFNGCCSSRMRQKLRMSIKRGNTNWGFDGWTTDLVRTVARVAGVAFPEGPAVGMTVFSCIRGGWTATSLTLEAWEATLVSSVGGTDEGWSLNLPHIPSRMSQSFNTSTPKRNRKQRG